MQEDKGLSEIRQPDEIIAEAKRLILKLWDPPVKTKFDNLQKEFIESYPENEEQFNKLIEISNDFEKLKVLAYDLGKSLYHKKVTEQKDYIGLIEYVEGRVTILERLYPVPKKTIDKIRKFKEIIALLNFNDIKGFEYSVLKQYNRGLMVSQKGRKDFFKKANGESLSNVKPRSTEINYTNFSISKPNTRNNSPINPQGIHPNDIRSLNPSDNWLLVMDETGDRFNTDNSGMPGKFVGILINNNNPELKPLKFHSIDSSNTDEIDQIVQNVLDAPVGIIGITLNGLPDTAGECWLDGMYSIIEMVVRLLTLNGLTNINICIENRAQFKANSIYDAVGRYILSKLARTWPYRASLIDLKIQIVDKDHPYISYADAIASTWGSNAISSKERLKLSKLTNSCLIEYDARILSEFWDNWDRPNGISASDWTNLLSSPDNKSPSSLTNTLLNSLAESCKSDNTRITNYLNETKKHLYSKSVNLPLLKSQIDWLMKVIPSERILPEMKLVWLTAKLAYANHIGETEKSWIGELKELNLRLMIENAPLVCEAALHLAVNYTNRFDFEGASNSIDLWKNIDHAVPGLCNWGRIKSTEGQHLAFKGDNDAAILKFDEAIEAFKKLSDPEKRQSEISQTMCYKIISMIDNKDITDDVVEENMKIYLRELNLTENLSEIAKVFAQSDDDFYKYAHHTFMRWLVFRGNKSLWECYLSGKDNWKNGYGHPWSLILLYRAILIHETDKELAIDLTLQAAGIAFSSEQGPTVNLIGAVCRSIAHKWGNNWEKSNEVLSKLCEDLPYAKDRIDIITHYLESADLNEIDLVKKILPFNFR